MRVDSTALFVSLDDFCKLYDKALSAQALPSPQYRCSRQGLLSLRELMFMEGSHRKHIAYNPPQIPPPYHTNKSHKIQQPYSIITSALKA